ncbi:alanine--glyoxylate aminotransferase family protein [Svornostia abyssi]|uniref:Alanine--glyoxylate aminotransferase family protein n=1 Tax=Svornostia abyssi TaxID=2898438 RepID=A0ABY5PLL4_9ACTN|nr:alanine--glyoxylate aminotransferase family protein [Parviterribacteraceae bacterium J379]
MSATVDTLPERLLLGSGPSPVPEPVLHALARPTLGHLDPAFGEVMDEIGDLLRAAFVTENEVAFPISGTGSAGMEAMVANLIEPGERVVCGVHGLFGERMADELARHGADVVRVEAEWGRAIDPQALIDAVAAGPAPAALFVVHGETSTGVAQPLDGLADAIHDRDGLLLVDCVTSLTGHPLRLDEAGVDAAFSGSQKCLNAPPGLAPFTVGARALEKLRARKTRVPSWYFDLNLILAYVNAEGARTYHHTAPTNMNVALREALRIAVVDEWLATRWERHRRAHEALRSAFDALGMPRLAPEGEALHPLLAVRVPDGIDEAAVRRALLLEHDIEISGGLGPLAGKVWRIGVMGVGAQREPQEALITAVAAELGHDTGEALVALADGWSA